MSFNNPTDVESVLQVAPTPPTATPTLTRGSFPFPVAADALPNKLAAPPTPVSVPPAAGALTAGVPVPLSTTLSTKAPLQAPPSAKPASVQMAPTAPTDPPVIAPLAQTPTAAAQMPLITTPGTLTQS